MRLSLGDHTFELATRPLVMGVLAAPGGWGPSGVPAGVSEGRSPQRANVMVGEGADLVEVDVAHEQEVAAAVADVPVVTRWHKEVAGIGDVRIVTHIGPGSFDEVRDHLVACARKFEAAGTPSDCIVIDPGIDRHKSPEQRVDLLRRTEDLAALGYPLLMTCESAAEVALAVTNGCRIVRTFDVRGSRRACDVIAAILEAE